MTLRESVIMSPRLLVLVRLACAALALGAPGAHAGMAPEAGHRVALVVAVGRAASPAVPPAAMRVAAAEALAAVLRDGFGFDVTMLADSAATASELYRRINQLRNALRPGDTLFVFLGTDSARLREFEALIPFDGDPGRPSSLIPVREVTAALAGSDGEAILVAVDACIAVETPMWRSSPAQRAPAPLASSRPDAVELLAGCFAPSADGSRPGLAGFLVDALSRAAADDRRVGTPELAAQLGALAPNLPSYSQAAGRFTFIPTSRNATMAAVVGTEDSRAKAIGELGQLLSSAGADARRPEALRVLSLIVDDEDASLRLRVAAVAALAGAREPGALEPLVDLVDEPDAPAELRVEIVGALERRGAGDGRVVSALEDAAIVDGSAAAIAAVRSLAALRSTASTPRLLKVLDRAKSPEAALTALEALQQLEIRQPRVGETARRVMERSSADASLRRSAIAFLGWLDDGESDAAIVARLERDKDVGVRRAAAAALGAQQVHPRRLQVLAALVNALQADDAALRAAAATSLGQLKDGQARGPLGAALQDREPRVRAAAARALAAVGPSEAGPLVRGLREDVSSDARAGFALALATTCNTTTSVEARNALNEVSLTDRDPGVREGARLALSECRTRAGSPAMEDLEVPHRALGSPDASIRKAALARLAGASGPEVMPALITALDDGDYEVRQAAISIVAKTPGAVLPLSEALEQGTIRQRLAAAAALGATQQRDAVAPLVAHVGDPDGRVRVAAVRALGGISDPAARKALQPIAEGADGDVLKAAIDALREMCGALYREQRHAEGLELASLASRASERAGVDGDVAIDLNNMAVFQQKLGRLPEALQLSERALTVRLRSLGEEHPAVAVSLNNLAAVHIAMGQPDRAEALLIRSLRIRQATLGPDDPDTVQSLENLANLYERRGRGDAALSFRRQAAEARDRRPASKR